MKSYKEIQTTHELYCTLTGLFIPWEMRRLWNWEQFCLKFSDDDLRIVIKFIKDKVRMGKPARSFTFRNFIGGPESISFFEEDLAEAKARNRATRKDPERTAVLRATGREENHTRPARTSADVIAGDLALQQFIQLKEAL